MLDLIPVAETLREAGWRVELDPRDRRPAANLSYAERARIPVVAIYGDAERDAGQVVLRDLAARTEQRPALTALPQVRRTKYEVRTGALGAAEESS